MHFTASIPVMPGDIIIMATDGLFDNLDLSKKIFSSYIYKVLKAHILIY